MLWFYQLLDILDRVTGNAETALIGLLAISAPALALYLLGGGSF